MALCFAGLPSHAASHTSVTTVGRRWFHTAAAVLLLAFTIAGFHRYYLRGVGMGERTIDPAVTTLVVAHMPIFHPIFGEAGWQGIFGPIFTIGVILVGARAWLAARLDRWITGGFVVLVAAYLLATTTAVTAAGRGLLRAAFGF